MARQNRTVADRQKSLQPSAPEANFTLAGVKLMYAGMGGEEFPCTISGHCRTQIFQFPRIDFHPNGDELELPRFGGQLIAWHLSRLLIAPLEV